MLDIINLLSCCRHSGQTLVFKYTSDCDTHKQRCRFLGFFPERLTPAFWVREIGDMCLGETFTPPLPPHSRAVVMLAATPDKISYGASLLRWIINATLQNDKNDITLSISTSCNSTWKKDDRNKKKMHMRLVTWFRLKILRFNRVLIPYQTIQVSV